jgi:hypothetical protein
MAPQRLRWAPQNLVGVWLHHSSMLALVHHCSNSAAPEFLQVVADNFVVHLLLGSWKNLLLQSFSFIFSLPAQEVLPLTNLLSLQEKVLIFNPIGASLLWPL